MVAFAVHESGRREVIGIEIAESETEAGWAAFLRELVARGLEGVRLCVSDDRLGLKAAIAKVLGCSWQRCTVHFIRNMHGHCKKGQRNMVSAALREVFNAEDLADAKERSASVTQRLAPTVAKVAALLEAAEEDLLVGSLLIEQNDEWLLTRGYLSQESIGLVLEDQTDEGGSEVALLEG